MPPREPVKRHPGRLLVGSALTIIGILIALPSGLCTTVFGMSAISRLVSEGKIGDWVGLWPLALACAAALVVGLLLIRFGVSLRDRS